MPEEVAERHRVGIMRPRRSRSCRLRHETPAIVRRIIKVLELTLRSAPIEMVCEDGAQDSRQTSIAYGRCDPGSSRSNQTAGSPRSRILMAPSSPWPRWSRITSRITSMVRRSCGLGFGYKMDTPRVRLPRVRHTNAVISGGATRRNASRVMRRICDARSLPRKDGT